MCCDYAGVAVQGQAAPWHLNPVIINKQRIRTVLCQASASGVSGAAAWCKPVDLCPSTRRSADLSCCVQAKKRASARRGSKAERELQLMQDERTRARIIQTSQASISMDVHGMLGGASLCLGEKLHSVSFSVSLSLSWLAPQNLREFR